MTGIIPQPKEVEALAGLWRPDAEHRLILAAPVADQARLSAELCRITRLQPQQIRVEESRDSGVTVRSEKLAAPAPTGAWFENPQGYRLAVSTSGLLLQSKSSAGAFHGLQTLRQLARADAFLACEVRDWPSLNFRGAHLFTSASGVEWHQRMVRDVFARFKLNAVVVQCESARWNVAPEIAAPNSATLAGLQRLVGECRETYLEPIPLINLPGHAGWVFRNGRNLQLAEDGDALFAVCVRHPEVWPYVERVLEEARQVFRPRTFHLGMDEITLRGKFPSKSCPRCKDSDTATLLSEYLAQASGWCRRHGVTPMLWGDMFLSPDEASDAGHAPNRRESARRREAIPPEALIADWQYGVNDRYQSVDVFSAARVIGSTWHKPKNIHRFSNYLVERGARGLLQTTWCGHFPDQNVLRSEMRQFSAFVLAAEYAWSGRTEAPDDLPYKPAAEFLAAMGPG